MTSQSFIQKKFSHEIISLRNEIQHDFIRLFDAKKFKDIKFLRKKLKQHFQLRNVLIVNYYIYNKKALKFKRRK